MGSGASGSFGTRNGSCASEGAANSRLGEPSRLVRSVKTDSALAVGLRVLRRRWWIALTAVLGAILAAGVLSHLQTPRYQSSAEVLLNTRDVAATLTGSSDPAASLQPERNAQTQADIARTPALAERVLRAVSLSRTPTAFLDASDVSPKSNADLLVFRVSDGNPVLAERLANAYARQYTIYRREIDSAALRQARRDVDARLAQLRKEGEGRSSLYALLLGKAQQLETIETLQSSNASLARPATAAVKTQPRLKRNLLLAAALGLLLGGALTLVWDTLDTRVRSGDEALEVLGLPLIAQVPEMRAASRGGSPILVDPSGREAETFRILRTNLAFATLERGKNVRTVMVTSAVEQEGKSTTAANLALVSARAGRRVVLVDLELRRPTLDHLFGLEGRPGLTDVALGDVSLGQALTRIPLSQKSEGTVKGQGGSGTLEVLCCGPLPPEPGEFVVTQAVGDILAELEERAELVIVDASPLLPVGDARALTARVGGVLVVTRMAFARRKLLEDLRNVLAMSPALLLGVVLVGAGEEAIAGYEAGSRRRAGSAWPPTRTVPTVPRAAWQSAAEPRSRSAGVAGSSTNGASGDPLASTNGGPPEARAEAPRAAAAPVKLDAASLEELLELPGIGEARARRIIEYRSRYGSFRSFDELAKVAALSRDRLDRLSEQIEL